MESGVGGVSLHLSIMRATAGGGRRRWAAYGAAAWAFAFGAMSFYWALGGRLSLGTQALSIREQVDDPGFVAVLWATGALKVAAGVIALALVRPFGRKVPRRVRLVVAGGIAVLLLLYGGLGWVESLLWETGVVDIPASVGADAARWKLAFWDPFWLLGGVLFLVAVVQFRRSDIE
ncbi:MAG: hypothetical protein QOH36_474 [Actinomycetota bacterium]|nr:hypothetical protein [Actinomycetota bacterium]